MKPEELDKLDSLAEPLTEIIDGMYELMKDESDCFVNIYLHDDPGLKSIASYSKKKGKVSFGNVRASNNSIFAFKQPKKWYRAKKEEKGITFKEFRGVFEAQTFFSAKGMLDAVKDELKISANNNRIEQIKTLLKFPELVSDRRTKINQKIDDLLIPFFANLDGVEEQRTKKPIVNSKIVAEYECGWTKTLDRLDELVEPIEKTINAMYDKFKDETKCAVFLNDKYRKEFDLECDLFYQRKEDGVRFGLGSTSYDWKRVRVGVQYFRPYGIIISAYSNNKYKILMPVNTKRRALYPVSDSKAYKFSSIKQLIEQVKYELKYTNQTCCVDYLKAIVNFDKKVQQNILEKNEGLQTSLDSLFDSVEGGMK